MTRMLSDIFGTEEHTLRQGLDRLERVSGFGSADVRLTADMLQATKRKLHELGLDPHDTTGQELYGVLVQRLQDDDARLSTALRKLSGSEAVVDGVAQALRSADIPRNSFALKATVAKALLKSHIPKQTMRQLGYRSLESMLKHEQIGALFAAAWLLESVTWRRSFHDSYKKLKAVDFEVRDIAVLSPNAERWQKLASTLVSARMHTVVALKELGTIVLLPQPSQVPPAVTMTTLILALHSMNEIRAASTFLKLSQVRPDFGAVVQEVVADEPQLSADMLDQRVPWQIIQRYYSRFQEAFHSNVFEPHIQASDLSWHSIEQVLKSIEPSLSFWEGTDYLSIVEDHQPISLNIIDVALAVCNNLPYEQRIVHYLQHSLQAELLLKYLKHDNVEQLVLERLESELVAEPALI